MPIINGSMTIKEGAVVKVAVGLSYSSMYELRQAQRPVPAPREVSALLDTGAEVTCADSALIQDLELPYDSSILANVPATGGLTFGMLFDASLTILHPSGRRQDHLVFRNKSLLELSLGVLDYQILIGRDVLAKCMFRYNGMGQRFSIKY